MPRLAHNAPATQKQKNYVAYLLRATGTDADTVTTSVFRYPRDIESLTVREIGRVITSLKTRLADNGNGNTSLEQYSLSELQSKALVMFPNESSAIERATKPELIEALSSGRMPYIPATRSRNRTPKGSGIERSEIQEMINDALAEYSPNVDMTNAIAQLSDEIDAVITRKMEALNVPRVIHVKHNDTDNVIDVGLGHKELDRLLRRVRRGLNVLLVGPAASFKTHAASQVAKALNLPYATQSVTLQTTKSDLLGYRNMATGEYVSTPFRDCYEHGGVFLLDEIDAGNENVLLVLNAGTSNGEMAFADGMVKRHPNFRLIAAANTNLTGANALYTGRRVMDAAMTDRYVVIQWEYDNALERAIAMNLAASEGCSSDIATAWIDRVQALREALFSIREDSRPRCVISPRATFNGIKILADGDSADVAESETLWAKMSETDKREILSRVS